MDMPLDLDPLHDELVASLPANIELAYIDRSDHLAGEALSALVDCDLDTLYDQTDEWYEDMRFDSAEELALETVRSMLGSDAPYAYEVASAPGWHDLVTAVLEHDESDVIGALLRNTPDVLVRWTILADGYPSGESVDPVELLTRVGLPVTPANVEAARDVAANAYDGGMVQGVALVSAVDLFETVDAPTVTIKDPSLWLGSPFYGDGWLETFEGTLTVARAALRLDSDGPGHSWETVAGGFVGPSSEMAGVVEVARLTA